MYLCNHMNNFIFCFNINSFYLLILIHSHLLTLWYNNKCKNTIMNTNLKLYTGKKYYFNSVWYSLVIPNVLIWTAKVAHKIVDLIGTLSTRPIQGIHSPKDWSHLCSAATCVWGIPCTVDQVSLWSWHSCGSWNYDTCL